MRVDEFPWGKGISIWELRDGNAECRLHGRCAFDRTPPCGCFAIEAKRVAPVSVQSRSEWVLERLRAHIEEIGEVPRQREWAAVAPKGASLDIIRGLFGTWNGAVVAAGFEPRRQTGGPVEERFWRRVHKTDFCWLWTGKRGNHGYGVMKFGERVTTAHRVAYELLIGPIPAGRHIDHLCRNIRCVNPDHLEAVLPQENIRRGKHAKVTWEMARAIRVSSGTNVELGRRFGISETVVSRIRSGEAWQESQDPSLERGRPVTELPVVAKRKKRAA